MIFSRIETLHRELTVSIILDQYLTGITGQQGTKIFQYCTCPAGRVTYNFHSSCKHMHLSFKSVCNKEHQGVIWLPCVILPKALILQDECLGRNYSFYLDFTCNYEQTSGILSPGQALGSGCALFISWSLYFTHLLGLSNALVEVLGK